MRIQTQIYLFSQVLNVGILIHLKNYIRFCTRNAIKTYILQISVGLYRYSQRNKINMNKTAAIFSFPKTDDKG